MSAKVIFITGATSGFGGATARLFAKNDWKVIATGRRIERLEELQNEFPAGQIHIAKMDLTDEAGIKSVVAELPEDFKPVTCLFNNGGLALGTKPIPDVSMKDWRIMVETNVMGVLNTTMEVLPLLKQAGRGASIINVSSIAANFAYPGGNVYGASKAFVSQFSYELRCDLEGSDIRVTSLEPGLAKSEFTAVRNHGDFEINETFYDGTEPVLPEDIAETVFWLATRPHRVNVNRIEIMAQCQTPGIPKVLRT